MEETKQSLEKTFSIFKRYATFIKEVGDYEHNYFLADLIHFFKPHPKLSPEEIKEYWADNTDRGKFYSLYLHVPFCRKKCTYCIYPTKPLKEDDELDKYIGNLKEEIKFYGAGLNIDFKTLYIGGGTPSLLSSQHLDKLLSEINNFFSFDKRGEKTVELNPDSSSGEKLKVLKQGGINRVSFGVQSMKKDILKEVNRGYQNKKMVKENVQKAKEIGFKCVNTDLILGLKKSTIEDTLQSFEELANLEPSSICIYPLQPNSSYLEGLGIKEETFFTKIEDKIEKIKQPIREIAKKWGYKAPKTTPNPRDANAWMFHLKDDNHSFEYSYHFGNPEQDGCLALGVPPSSYIRGKINYSRIKNGIHFKKQKKLYRGTTLTKKDEMRQFILDELADKQFLNLDSFQQRFGSELSSEFKEKIRKLEKLNLVRFEGDKMYMTSESPKCTFAACMFFFDEDSVLNKIKEDIKKFS